MIQTLMSVTTNFLHQLMKELDAGRIDKDGFQNHSKEKMEFLKKHKEKISQMQLKRSVEDVIQACEKILDGN